MWTFQDGDEVDELCKDESECQETAEQVCYPLKDPSGQCAYYVI